MISTQDGSQLIHHKRQPSDLRLVTYLKPLLSESEQNDVVSFLTWTGRLSKHFEFVKVAEGGYGDVYKLREKEGSELKIGSKLHGYGGVVLKVIPLRARDTEEEQYETVTSVLQETKVLKKMDEIHGFARFRKINIVQGKYPQALCKAFQIWKSEGGDCQSDDPEEYPQNQLYSVMEMGDAGKDLEGLKQPSIFQAYDIFWQTVIILAIAEEQVNFEHRDLHIGNICIKPWEEDGRIDVSEHDVSKMYKAPDHWFGLTGLRATIIDYTLSRAAMDSEKRDIVYDPMEDDGLFEQYNKNDSEADLQYMTYRYMRNQVDESQKHAFKAKPKRKITENQKWGRFVPRTNVVWLCYLLQILFRRSGQRIVKNSNAVAEGVQCEMYECLADVIFHMDVHGVNELPLSAKDLLSMAQNKEWLTREEIEAFKTKLEEEA